MHLNEDNGGQTGIRIVNIFNHLYPNKLHINNGLHVY